MSHKDGQQASRDRDHHVEIWVSLFLSRISASAHLNEQHAKAGELGRCNIQSLYRTSGSRNPPRPFRLLIDLAGDTLFVASADCKDSCEYDGPNALLFFSNQSPTYSELLRDAWLVYSTVRFTGHLARDTFCLAGLEIQDQSFINVDRADPLGFLSFYYAYDD